jgi:hypothetical protein
MFSIHAMTESVTLDGMPYDQACDAGNLSAPFPTAAATAAETSFSAAQREFKKRLLARLKFIRGSMFR